MYPPALTAYPPKAKSGFATAMRCKIPGLPPIPLYCAISSKAMRTLCFLLK